jgi:ribosomal-protein-alanine N-acetyltransferase
MPKNSKVWPDKSGGRKKKPNNAAVPQNKGRRFSMSIRAAQPSDLSALCILEETSFTGDKLSLRSLQRFLNRPSAKVLVAETQKSCLGYALILFRKNSLVARLYSIAVDRAARGRGVGRALLEASEGVARKRGCLAVRLEVRADNTAARAMYLDAGYTAKVVIGAYYEDGMAAVRLEKRFTARGSMGRT